MPDLGGVGDIVGGVMGSNAASDAADAQERATQKAVDEQKRQFDLNRNDLAPYRETGGRALASLEGYLGNNNRLGYLLQNFSPDKLTEDPGYQFRLSEGQRGIANGAAAAGMQLSGSTLRALERFNSDNASQEYGNAFNHDAANKSRIFNFLSGVAGTGQTAAQTGAALGTESANTIGQLYQDQGNARAAGIVGSANAWGSALGSLGNRVTGMNYVNALSGGGKTGGNAFGKFFGFN